MKALALAGLLAVLSSVLGGCSGGGSGDEAASGSSSSDSSARCAPGAVSDVRVESDGASRPELVDVLQRGGAPGSSWELEGDRTGVLDVVVRDAEGRRVTEDLRATVAKPALEALRATETSPGTGLVRNGSKQNVAWFVGLTANRVDAAWTASVCSASGVSEQSGGELTAWTDPLWVIHLCSDPKAIGPVSVQEFRAACT